MPDHSIRGARGWILDEAASAGRENMDPEHVSLYDQKEDSAQPTRSR